jgi:hypothetical protein
VILRRGGISRAGSPGWWAAKTRRVGAFLFGRVRADELAALDGLASTAQLALFRAMHRSDQRHSLDVIAALRAQGATEPDLLLAGLLHDCGKGQTGLVPRIVYSLSQAYGGWVAAPFRLLPGVGEAIMRLERHAELSARLAATVGCSARCVDLIRHHVAPRDPDLGRLLHLADEAS